MKKNTTGIHNRVNILTAMQLALGIETSHFVWCEPLDKEILSTGTQARQQLDEDRRKRCKFQNPPDWHRSL